MTTPNIDVNYVAQLARISLTIEEEEEFTKTIGVILEHVNQLQQYDVSDIMPTSHAVPVYDRMRADIQEQSLSQEAVLMNAPEQGQEQIRVPKVVETA